MSTSEPTDATYLIEQLIGKLSEAYACFCEPVTAPLVRAPHCDGMRLDFPRPGGKTAKGLFADIEALQDRLRMLRPDAPNSCFVAMRASKPIQAQRGGGGELVFTFGPQFGAERVQGAIESLGIFAGKVRTELRAEPARPMDLIPMAKVCRDFSVSRATVLRRVDDGTLTSWRRDGAPENATHLFSKADCERLFGK